MKKVAVVALLALLVVAIAVGRGLASRPQQARAPAPLSNLPDGRVELLEAVPFALDAPFVHEWRAEKPAVSAGYLLVLEVAPELARPRQTYEAVLYVGDQTAERCNYPEESGILVALVPAPLVDGRVDLDLARTPIWFGALELPERVDAPRIARERAQALRAGIGPVRRGARFVAAPAAPVFARDRGELEATYLADLIERWSPEESDLVSGLRVR